MVKSHALGPVSLRESVDTLLSVGDVKVLFVNVSVVALPTNVSVAVGNVKVPVLTIVPMTGDVSVLFVRV